MADSMVAALIKEDRAVIFSSMEKEVKEYYDHAAFNAIINKMVAMFGSPIEAKFKKSEQGRKRAENGYDKPMLKHWYAVKTSNFDFGNHFIFVEIVPEGEEFVSSGISIVNFPLGVPEDMQ